MADIMTNPPEWNAAGTEPTQTKKDEGWQVEERPPAGWLNWLLNRTYVSLIELAQALTGHRDATAPHIGHETPAGAQAKADAAGAAAKSYADSLVDDITPASIGAETPAGAQAKVDAHASATSVHSATSAATAGRLIIRDSSGRAQVAAPSAAADIARKDTVDAVSTILSSHTGNKSNPHAVTAAQVGAETPAGAQAKVDTLADWLLRLRHATLVPPSGFPDIPAGSGLGSLLGGYFADPAPGQRFKLWAVSWSSLFIGSVPVQIVLSVPDLSGGPFGTIEIWRSSAAASGTVRATNLQTPLVNHQLGEFGGPIDVTVVNAGTESAIPFEGGSIQITYTIE